MLINKGQPLTDEQADAWLRRHHELRAETYPLSNGGKVLVRYGDCSVVNVNVDKVAIDFGHKDRPETKIQISVVRRERSIEVCAVRGEDTPKAEFLFHVGCDITD